MGWRSRPGPPARCWRPRTPSRCSSDRERESAVPSWRGGERGFVMQTWQRRTAGAGRTWSLPASTGPWGLLAAGIVLLGLGLAAVIRPVRLWVGLAAVVGALLVIVSLAFSLPQKASAADTMNRHLQPVYTQQML